MEQRIAPPGPSGFTVLVLTGAILAIGTLAGSLGSRSDDYRFAAWTLPANDTELVDQDALERLQPPRARQLTLDELDAFAVEAGWPRVEGWWPEMRRIIAEDECPALNTHCFNPDDPNGGSYGLAQLNGRQHFDTCGEDFRLRYDPVVNLRTALCLRAIRGNFGGPGGWAGADRLGIE